MGALGNRECHEGAEEGDWSFHCSMGCKQVTSIDKLLLLLEFDKGIFVSPSGVCTARL